MTNEATRERLGPVLYRQPPDSRGIRAIVLAVALSIPVLMVPLVRPELATYIFAVGGVCIATFSGFAIDRLLARRRFDTIHERGALLHVAGAQRILWFNSETLVTEIHEIVRDLDEPDDDQWVFEVRNSSGTFAMSTYLPCSADHIRKALTRAIGEPPRLIERR